MSTANLYVSHMKYASTSFLITPLETASARDRLVGTPSFGTSGRTSPLTSLKRGQLLSSGWTNNSASILLNSRSLIRPCLGDISFLNDLPTWTAPTGRRSLPEL